MKNIRSRNIEARFIGDDKYACEIVKWFPNDLYGHKDEYEEDSFGMYVKKNGDSMARFSEGCFVNPENCYVICFVTNSDEPDIISVGNRPWELGLLDKEDFDYVKNRAISAVARQFMEYDTVGDNNNDSSSTDSKVMKEIEHILSGIEKTIAEYDKNDCSKDSYEYKFECAKLEFLNWLEDRLKFLIDN